MNTYKTLCLATSLLLSVSTYSMSIFDKGEHGGNEGNGMQTVYGISLNVDSPTSISVFPGSNIEYSFSSSNLGKVNISILDALGNVVMKRALDTDTNNYLDLDISRLPKGAYKTVVKNAYNAVLDYETFVIR